MKQPSAFRIDCATPTTLVIPLLGLAITYTLTIQSVFCLLPSASNVARCFESQTLPTPRPSNPC